MRTVLLVAAILIATPVFARVSVTRASAKAKTVNVSIEGEQLSLAIQALKPYLTSKVQVAIAADPLIDYTARNVAPDEALTSIVAAAGATLTFENKQFWVRNDPEPKVTLDVKDVDIHAIFKTMQKQCGIKNLVIDPGVEGKGTFLFDRVPCRTAFDVVFRTMGLASVDYGNSVVTVGRRK